MNNNGEIKKFKKRAFANISNNYHCNLFLASIIAKFTHNDSYYRYKCYKYLRKYMSGGNIIRRLFNYRNYSKYAHKINVQLICKYIGSNFYFEHGDIVINKSSVIGDNVRLVGNNCIGGGEMVPLPL